MRKLFIICLIFSIAIFSINLLAEDSKSDEELNVCEALVYGCYKDALVDVFSGNKYEQTANENSYILVSELFKSAIKACELYYQQGWIDGNKLKKVGITTIKDSAIVNRQAELYNACMEGLKRLNSN